MPAFSLRHRPSAQGVTLIELVVVVAILAILAGLAVPSFRAMILNNRITTATQELESLLQWAKSEALLQTITVGQAPTDTANGQTPGPVTWQAKKKVDATLLRELTLPASVQLTASDKAQTQFGPGLIASPLTIGLSAIGANQCWRLQVTGNVIRKERQACPKN